MAVLLLCPFLPSCTQEDSPEDLAIKAAATGETQQRETHLGGCILTTPLGDVPADLYQTTELSTSNDYPPFSKALTVYGLTLVAQDDASDDFMQLVAQTIREIFPQEDGINAELQQKILRNHYRYKAVIPVPKGGEPDFSTEDELAMEALQAHTSVCDIIMEDVPGQVMEVVEHILHYVTDLGLHYSFPDEWGIKKTSVLGQAMDEAIAKGYYKVDGYDDIDTPDVRYRVEMQEFAYWVISTAWNLQEPYGPREDEWTLLNREDLEEKLPELYAALVQTVGETMRPPSSSTLRAIGPTRAEERNP